MNEIGYNKESKIEETVILNNVNHEHHIQQIGLNKAIGLIKGFLDKTHQPMLNDIQKEELLISEIRKIKTLYFE